MAEYVVKLADERGRIQEQVQIAGPRRSCAAVFPRRATTSTPCGRAACAAWAHRKKANLEAFIIFNQQFLTLIRAGLPIVGSLDMLVKGQKNPTFRAQLETLPPGCAPANHCPAPLKPRVAFRLFTPLPCWLESEAAN